LIASSYLVAACTGSSAGFSPSGIGQFAAVQAVAPSLGVDLSAVDVRDAGEIERAVTAFARSSIGGLIVTASALPRPSPTIFVGTRPN
jgi:hypothetical protein